MKFYSFAGFKDNEYEGCIVTPFNDSENIIKGFNKLGMDVDAYCKCEVWTNGKVVIIPPDRDVEGEQNEGKNE